MRTGNVTSTARATSGSPARFGGTKQSGSAIATAKRLQGILEAKTIGMPDTAAP